MGLILSNAEFLLSAHERGVSFNSILTLGRQNIYLREEELSKLQTRYGRGERTTRAFPLGSWADDFFREFLEARRVDSVDYSAFEGATLLHDMNRDIPPEMEGSFDAVIDMGGLEHIFNFVTALRNCMRMVRVGGSLFITTMANNHCGHGFYQFSPELFFRALSPEQGFKVVRMVLVKHLFPGAELSSGEPWYQVADPAAVGQRVGLVTDSPVILMVEAMKSVIAPVFACCPQQSDYVAAWNRTARPSADSDRLPSAGKRLVRFLGRLAKCRNLWDLLELGYNLLPVPVRHAPWFVGMYQKKVLFSIHNRRFFRRLSEEEH